jgi:Flp pilus assembly protein protease CpaA
MSLTAKAFGWAGHSWLSLAGGLSLGLAVGFLLFWFGGFRGGDVKVLASVGAAIGVSALGPVLFYTAIAVGGVAFIGILKRVKYVPYVPAITAGFILSWITRGVV